MVRSGGFLDLISPLCSTLSPQCCDYVLRSTSRKHRVTVPRSGENKFKEILFVYGVLQDLSYPLLRHFEKPPSIHQAALYM
jgi:hypothetical protein